MIPSKRNHFMTTQETNAKKLVEPLRAISILAIESQRHILTLEV